MTDSSNQLEFGDVLSVLKQLDGLQIVLIGGQAVAFWVEQYIDRLPQLRAQMPFTSKDIDFCGDRELVVECARRIGGRPVLPDLNDATPNSGIVVFLDASGNEVVLDLLSEPLGVARAEVLRTSIGVGLGDGHHLRVMHPVPLMFSRVKSVMTLGDTLEARKKLLASVLCAREFLRDRLDENLVRKVLDNYEKIFDFCRKDLHGRQIANSTGIDPFDAVLADERLPEAFRLRRLPQMHEVLSRARKRYSACDANQQ